MSCSCNGICTCRPLERVRYFPRQLMSATEMTAEQEYFRQRLRRHNRYLHGWGVTCGFEVQAVLPDQAPPEHSRPWAVRICPGYGSGPQGDEINVCEPIVFDLSGEGRPEPDPCAPVWPCPPTGRMPANGKDRPTPVYIAVRYAECDNRPVRVHPTGCGCDNAICEYSRIRESFELAVLWELPKSHLEAIKADNAWHAAVQEWVANQMKQPMPVPHCPECPDEPWLVLARVQLPNSRSTAITQADIDYQGRRVLLGVSSLTTFATCLSTP